MRTISYKQAIALAIEDDDMMLYIDELVMNHKNWGQFSCKLPSWVVVNLVERIKAMAEEQLGDRIPLEVDDEDV